MKKIIIIIVCLVFMTSCTKDIASTKLQKQNNTDSLNTTLKTTSESSPDVNNNVGSSDKVDLEIKEKMFVTQINDIYLNIDDYLGKTIKYEGIFDVYDYEPTGTKYYYVIRYGPGCCGTDSNAGFEVVWDGSYPKKFDWVEVVGKLELYENENDGFQYLRLVLSSLNVLPVRGAEYVYQ